MTGSYAAITDGPIDEEAVRAAVDAASSGAIVLFEGVVRNHDRGADVLALDYQAHPDAERVLRECCDAVSAKTGLRVAAAHRVGHLVVGDVALYAAAAAAHRAEAFAACEELVESIKASVPIWKKQHLADGETEWVNL